MRSACSTNRTARSAPAFPPPTAASRATRRRCQSCDAQARGAARQPRCADVLAEHQNLHGASEPTWHEECLQRESLVGVEPLESICRQREQEIHLIEKADRNAAFAFRCAANAGEINVRSEVLASRLAQPFRRRRLRTRRP